MEHSPPGIRLRSSARTSTGQVRENNEDNIHLWTRDDFVLAIVADGMGGAAAGEEASRIAVEAIRTGLALRDTPDPGAPDKIEDSTLTEKLRESIQAANATIMQKAASSPEMRGMGTTLTMAFVRGTYAIVAHVGDSRAYLVDGDDGDITQITSDHSFVEALVLAGHITSEQAEDHPMKNVLYRALGQAEDVDVDMYYKRLHIGDRLVLCSDGLTRHVKPEEIARLALSDDNPDVASQLLIDLANERGGEDNVSVIVVSVEAAAPTAPSNREAVIASQLDDDDTLVLGNRARSALPDLDNLPPLEKKTPQDAATPPVETTGAGMAGVEAQRDAALPTPLDDDPKMRAERLKDETDHDFLDDSTEENQIVVQDDTIDRAIPTRPNHLDMAAVYDHSPPPPEKEAQVEGRDTLLPDQ